MPDLWFPSATRMPGKAAGYALTYDQPNGRNLMRLAKAHFTVGRDSRARGVDGYFQLLVSRDGEVTQFCEIDAYCMDSAQGNKWGPGCEIEYHPDYDADIFTPASRVSTAGVIDWLAGFGIPKTYYSGPRIDPAGYTGWLAHASIQQTDPHFDYWPQEDWDAMVAGPPPIKEPAMDYILARTDDGFRTLCTALGETEGINVPYAEALIAGGMVQVKIDGVGYTNMLNIRRAQRSAFVGTIPKGGVAPAPTKGTWTATP